MPNFAKFSDYSENLVYVVAFDPGETTGCAVLGAHPDDLRWPRSTLKDEQVAGPTWLKHIEYGQISCRDQSQSDWENTVKKHSGMMLGAETNGVEEMLQLVGMFPKSPIVIEDFIPDMNRMDQARHTLSPVRIISAFCYGLYRDGHSVSCVNIQNRSLAKRTCTDLRLKNWGLYDSHSGPHARDAIRHAYYFLRNCRGTGIEAQKNRFNAWPHLFDDPVITEKKKPTLSNRDSKPTGERIKSR